MDILACPPCSTWQAAGTKEKAFGFLQVDTQTEAVCSFFFFFSSRRAPNESNYRFIQRVFLTNPHTATDRQHTYITHTQRERERERKKKERKRKRERTEQKENTAMVRRKGRTHTREEAFYLAECRLPSWTLGETSQLTILLSFFNMFSFLGELWPLSPKERLQTKISSETRRD